MTDPLDTRARRAEGQSPYTPSGRKRRRLPSGAGVSLGIVLGLLFWAVAGLIIWIAI